MNNLNKENFFIEMNERFPDAMKHFCDWIDQYKKDVKWNKLFNCGSHKPKFHDIPLEMQIGILMKFAAETFKETDDLFTVEGMKTLFHSCLESIQFDKDHEPF